jgi:hypothetical protein
VVCLCLFVYISGIMNEINFNLGGLQQWSVCVPIFPAVVYLSLLFVYLALTVVVCV